MKYQLYQLRLEQLINYFKEGAVNLAPAFQRGRVWTPKLRRNLLSNVLHGKPVPAIFLYKKPSGARNIFVVLDGKQRLESILLYVADGRDGFSVPNWKDYFSRKELREIANFRAYIHGEEKTISELEPEETRRFRDYLLSIIEIEFDDTASLDEIIQLFVDINQYGVKVKRFDIVRALYLKDPLLEQVFELIAIKWEKKQRDPLLKMTKSVFNKVFKQLDRVKAADSVPNKIDIVWERLFELALFTQSGQHKKPSDILREFIARDGESSPATLTASQVILLRNVFKFVADGYKNKEFLNSRWATDQSHFYTMATALIRRAKDGAGALNGRFASRQPELSLAPTPTNGRELLPEWHEKLVTFSKLICKVENENRIGGATGLDGIDGDVEKYLKLTAKQTTDVTKRGQREELFWKILNAI